MSGSENPLSTKSLLGQAFFAASLMLAAPLAAQTNGTPDTPATEVGPTDLSNFSLQGNVTRPADRPAAAAPAPVPAPAPAQTTTSQPATTTPQPSRTTSNANPADLAPTVSRPTPEAISVTPAQPVATQRATVPPPSADSGVSTRPPLILPPVEDDGQPILPIVAGMLMLAGLAAIFYFVRQRGSSRPAIAGHGNYANPLDDVAVPPLAAPQPRPEVQPRHDPVPNERTSPSGRKPLATNLIPKPKGPAAAPAPASSAPFGIVSTSLRPWIEVELTPDRALVDDDGAAIAFDVTLFNSGAAPARDVSIETCLLNAGARQDNDLSDFFGRPRPSTDTIPVIAPQTRIPLRTAVKLKRSDIHEYEVEGRKLFMPLVAISTRYRWSSGEGQTGAGFLVGRGKEEETRLSPLRTDQGTRSWKGLGARRYEKGLRR
ncbi:MAG: hypothetical protein ABI667_01715 [Sphingomicrobium sp.]